MIAALSTEYPVHLLCRLLGSPRSHYYYQPETPADDRRLVTAIEQLLALHPQLGYRMVLARLRRQGWEVGERPARRILQGMARSRSAGRVVTTDSDHPHPRFPNAIGGLTPCYPGHVWVADITYLRYGRHFVYLAVILDAFTRAVRGRHLEESLTCEALTLPALEMALLVERPTFFHSDQGRQYAAAKHVACLRGGPTIISMSDTGRPTQNALVERFIRTVKEEHVAYTEYDSPADMRRQLKAYLEVEYNCHRPHSVLGYLTPLEFEQAYHRARAFQLLP